MSCLGCKDYTPSKHFKVVSTLLLGWYDVSTLHNVKSTLKQLCVLQRWNLQRSTTTNQRCHFQYRFSQRWATLKKMKIKPRFKNKIIFLSFKEYAGHKSFFISPHFKRNLQKNICKASKILKTSNILNNKKYI